MRKKMSLVMAAVLMGMTVSACGSSSDLYHCSNLTFIQMKAGDKR